MYQALQTHASVLEPSVSQNTGGSHLSKLGHKLLNTTAHTMPLSAATTPNEEFDMYNPN